MLSIIHGEHHIQSRTALTQAITAAQNQQRQIEHVEPKNLEPAALNAQLHTQSLFAQPRTVVIEELHSLPKSKRKEELIELLTQVEEQPDLDIILWEKKQLSATDLKKFPKAKVNVFVPTRSMFAWLNALSGEQNEAVKAKGNALLHLAVQSDGEQFCFAMLMRQVRLLLEAKEGSAPPTQFKTISQAKKFTTSQLLQLHRQLLLIDEQQKTSASVFSLSSQLELLLLSL